MLDQGYIHTSGHGQLSQYLETHEKIRIVQFDNVKLGGLISAIENQFTVAAILALHIGARGTLCALILFAQILLRQSNSSTKVWR
jgi:hypothetical protein